VTERIDFKFTEANADRDQEVARDVQNAAPTLSDGLAAAGCLQSSDAAQTKFAADGCDVDSLIRRGTKTRNRRFSCFAAGKDDQSI
jgi:hypothetical protein